MLVVVRYMLVVSKRAVRSMKNDQKYTQIPNLEKIVKPVIL
jgi:hypothetical protein